MQRQHGGQRRVSALGGVLALWLCCLVASARAQDGQDGPTLPVAVNDEFAVGPDSVTDLKVVDNDLLGNNSVIITFITQPQLFEYGNPEASSAVFMACDGVSNACVRYKSPSLAIMNGAPQIQDSFNYTIVDKVTNISSTAQVVMSIILPPVAVDDSFTVPNLRGTYNFSVLVNDADPNYRPLRITEVIVPLESAEIVVFTLPDARGTNDTIINIKMAGRPINVTYVISNGGALARAQLLVDGTAVPPPVMDDGFTAIIGRPKYLRVLRNDIEAGIYLNVSSFTGPQLTKLDAALEWVDECPLLEDDRWPLNCLSYTPPYDLPTGQNFAWDNFTYTAMDTANGATSVAQVSIKVILYPVAKDDFYYDAPLNDGKGLVYFVLDNDKDPNNLPLYITDVKLPKNSDANVTIVMDEYAIRVKLISGPVTFSYTISNGLGSATAKCTVTNRRTPVAPKTKDDEVRMTVGSSRLIRVLDNDQAGGYDLVIDTMDKPRLRGAKAELVKCWVQGERKLGCINYTAPATTGEDMFLYTVKGRNGLTMDAAVYAVVYPRPTAANDNYDIRDRKVQSLFVTGNDKDKAMLPFKMTKLSCTGAPPGTLLEMSLKGDSIDFEPPLRKGQGSKILCAYTITNKYGGTASANATITFDAPDAACPARGKGCTGIPGRYCDADKKLCVENVEQGYTCVYNKGCK